MKKGIAFLLVLALTVGVCCACTPSGKVTESAPQTAIQETELPADSMALAVEAYTHQLQRYYTALAEKWDEGKYYEHEMSALASYYLEGNPLDNVGFAFADMDKDGDLELMIGAIRNAQQDPAVFEIWTLVNGTPEMLVQSGYRNRYFVEHCEDGTWLVCNEASNSAANSAWQYYLLEADALNVQQAVVFDAVANEENPWFLASDDDWNTGNDTSIDENTAVSILDGHANAYAIPEYIPFSQLEF